MYLLGLQAPLVKKPCPSALLSRSWKEKKTPLCGSTLVVKTLNIFSPERGLWSQIYYLLSQNQKAFHGKKADPHI